MLVFIIGMRRSGTSILRELIMSHKDVDTILFEPHHLMFSLRVSDMVRYNNDAYVGDSIQEMTQLGNRTKWCGAKIALNAGIEAMNWRKIQHVFPNSRYVFITRDPKKTYDSWCRVEKSVRGICSYDMYLSWWIHINNSFNIGQSCHISYESLVDNVDKEMTKVWNLLNIEKITGLDKWIVKND